MRKLERFSTDAVRTRRLATFEFINNVRNSMLRISSVLLIYISLINCASKLMNGYKID